jgi:hypothetical protein
MRRSCWRNWRLGLGALLTLLAFGDIMPQTRAGCEQPTAVRWTIQGTLHLVHIDSMSSALPHSLPHHSTPSPQPSKGPNCSRVPLAPLAQSATTITPNQEWAYLSLVLGGPDPRGASHSREEDTSKPIYHTFRIYHPPR